LKHWTGQFGKEYTDRNYISLEDLDSLYVKTYGISRSSLNHEFLDDVLTKTARILEIGSNIGNQLLLLQKMGFTNLYGIEPQGYSVELSNQRSAKINLIQASAFNIPFKDRSFDLVFTSGLLIHISPKDINCVLDEIYRCSNKYIWGFEYWSDDYTNVIYRGNKDILWKTDFAKIYLNSFNKLNLIKENKLKHINSDNMTTIFLLKK
jgi:pseudaminic acid biosynthesis-associated methylase